MSNPTNPTGRPRLRDRLRDCQQERDSAEKRASSLAIQLQAESRETPLTVIGTVITYSGAVLAVLMTDPGLASFVIVAMIAGALLTIWSHRGYRRPEKAWATAFVAIVSGIGLWFTVGRWLDAKRPKMSVEVLTSTMPLSAPDGIWTLHVPQATKPPDPKFYPPLQNDQYTEEWAPFTNGTPEQAVRIEFTNQSSYALTNVDLHIPIILSPTSKPFQIDKSKPTVRDDADILTPYRLEPGRSFVLWVRSWSNYAMSFGSHIEAHLTNPADSSKTTDPVELSEVPKDDQPAIFPDMLPMKKSPSTGFSTTRGFIRRAGDAISTQVRGK